MQQDNSFERVNSNVPELIESGRVSAVRFGVLHIDDAVDVMQSMAVPQIADAVLEFAPKFPAKATAELPGEAVAEVIPINSHSRKVQNLSAGKTVSFDPLSTAQVIPARNNVSSVQDYAQAASDAALSTADHLRHMQDQLGIPA